jgi:tyrosyl-tRNA synthetase
MWRYYELLSFVPAKDVAKLKRECADGRNPRDAKVALAQEIVARFHSHGRSGEGAVRLRGEIRQRRHCPRPCRRSSSDERRRLPIAQLAKQAGIVESTSRRSG